MSDLISREGILEYLKTVTVTEGITFETGFKQILHDIETQSSTDIMECARAIKEYCRDRNSLDEPCEGCPFHFYVGYRGYCRFESLPAEWDLPEEEKGGE